MNALNFTPGPWRWEFCQNGKRLMLVGGARPQYDLTVMDFVRYGMGSAIPRFRDTAHDGLQLLHRLPDRADWIAPFPGREHHAHWCANVVHPDAHLIAAAPELLDLERPVATALFQPEGVTKDVGDKNLWFFNDPARAAATMRKLIATGEVDWGFDPAAVQP